MITLKITATVRVEGASSEEEVRNAVLGLGSGVEITDVTKTGPDESPEWVVYLKGEEVYPKKEVSEEAPPGGEAEKGESQELKDEQSEESK